MSRYFGIFCQIFSSLNYAIQMIKLILYQKLLIENQEVNFEFDTLRNISEIYFVENRDYHKRPNC